MEKRLTMILASLFLCVGMALAQTAVTGTVVSQEDGQPIIGATVRVAGSQAGTVTDADGRFSLSLPSGHNKLQVSYVGMETQEVTVRGRSIRVVMQPVLTDLDEVMVVAYGTTTKSAFTGSAAVLKSDEITKTANANALSALTGKVSGVQINSASGMPGTESFNIKIRGISSIKAGNDPLIILDGAPYDGDYNNINPNDIASMTVLKDAASAALYGSRGANGVVIITTKSGREGTSSLTFDAKWGSNQKGIPNYKTVDDPAKYYETYYQALKNYAMQPNEQNPNFPLSEADAHVWARDNLTANNSYGLGYNVFTVPNGQYLIGTDGRINPNATLGRVISYGGNEYTLMPDDWRDATFHNGLRQEYTLTGTANNAKGSFYGSASYLNNEGITIGSEYERFTGRLKADYQLKPWLKMGGNFSYAHSTTDYLGDEGSSSSSGNIFAVNTIAPIYPLYIRDGQGHIMTDPNTGGKMYDWGDGQVIGITRPIFSGTNPINANEMQENRSEGNAINATGYAEVRFLKDFKFTSMNTVMVNEYRETQTTQPYYGQFASMNGGVSKYHTRRWSYDYQQILNWHHLFGKHDVEVMVGHDYYRTRYYYLYGSRTNQFSPSNDELAGAVTDSGMNSYTTDYNTEGWLGRAQYNYDQKYFGSVSYRRDASSRFAPENRWGNFWSVGGAWIISKESWFNAPWVDELKIKASYGEQGNDNIGNYLYTDTYTITPGYGNISVIPTTTKGNRDISWEKGGNFNAGVEFSLFRGRLSGSVEYFYRKTSDMLAFFTLPGSYGYSGYYDNIGDMTNHGVEVELDGTIFRTKDFTWGINLNFTAYKNKITSMPAENKTLEVDGVGGYSSGNYFYGEGEPMYTWYLTKYAGIDHETGAPLFYQKVTEPVLDAEGNPTYDKDGNPITRTVNQKTSDYTKASRYLCGSALPWAYGGFGTYLTYKGFDFSIDFTYQLGGKVYDSSYASLMGMSSGGSSIHADLLNAWTPENKGSNIPRLVYGDMSFGSASDRWLESGSYLSLQNINLGYTLPSKWTTKFGVSKLRLYFSGSNLFVWSARQGLDPRQSISGGTSSAYYAPIRTLSGGITVTF